MSLSPDDLPNDVASLKALLLAADANTTALAQERDRLSIRETVLEGEVDRLTARNERLDHIVSVLRRSQFGRRSERISDDQIELALEDIETGHGVEDAGAEQHNEIVREAGIKARRANRGHLPKHLPREEVIIEPEHSDCPCCGGALHVIGEDISERLDRVPAKLKVIVTRRPKYACRSCTDGVVQAPAPARLITGGLPTEAFVADVLVSKYADHLPLYRQSQILGRDGIKINRSTLANWVGFAAFELSPLHERLIEILKTSPKLFCDETTCPVLDPGRGRTKTGYLWAIARDDRPWSGSDPPAVAYSYAPGRGREHAERLLAGYSGILQVDGYAAYKKLGRPDRPGGPVALALCWSHFRRRFYDIAKGGNAPIAEEVLKRIAALYTIEAEIHGSAPDSRRAARQARSRSLIDALKPWLEEKLARVSGRSPLAEAIRYGLSRWDELGRYLDDGRIEIDTNTVERSIRPIALNRAQSQERTLCRLRPGRRKLGDHRLTYRDVQTQRCEPACLADRHADQARQSLATKPHR